jgi:hypothetical protein
LRYAKDQQRRVLVGRTGRGRFSERKESPLLNHGIRLHPFILFYSWDFT